ncbi:hypothetical protein SAMN05421770_11323 [Granulicella rosea]|uniref:Streptogramin lyase n=1 Tax=Granulicella rosea TaxID=474952 RepID=A0A239MH96_9BACT|nr:hypothetical protein [Granulicella rosea]SNT42085.1 hypothetical protein SAMN05421770_11323 [Granulicella rosea]
MQWKNRRAYVRSAIAGLTAMTAAMLAGCGVYQSTASTNYTAPIVLQGQVFAGRNYMPGATVNVYATQPNGVASGGSYTGTAKLLASTTSNATGGWSLSGISCNSPDQLYVTAFGGVPYPSGSLTTNLVNNPNSLMMTAIGDCSILTSASSTLNVTGVVTNEASTVAAVWALRNFISINGTTVNVTSSATNYGGANGVGGAGHFAGLAHAFLNANNISPYKLGNFVQYTGGVDGAAQGGLVPVQELNSLAYAQYLCTIGSDGTSPGSFTYCNTLYQLATPPGGSAPANSLQAMWNIARYPGNNAAAILTFTLTPIPLSGQTTSQQINAGVYVPALTSAGTAGSGGAIDWSVAIYYLPGYGATSTGQGSAYPQFVTIDANDDVFFSNPSGSSSTQGNVIALTSAGQSLWTSPTDTTNLTIPRDIAADASGHIWVTNGGVTAASSFVQELNANTGAVVQNYASTATNLFGVAVDSLGNVWYDANTTTGQNLHELALNGSTYSEATFAVPPSSTTATLTQLRPDSNNNIWVNGYNASNSQALYFPNTGTAAAPAYAKGLVPTTLPGGSASYGIVPDASGNAYSASNGTGSGIFKTTVAGSGSSAVLSAASVAANPATASRYLDIDGAGSIWYLDNATGTYLYQYIPSTNTTNAYYSCYNAGTTTGTGTATSTVQTCTTGMSTKLDLAVDSSGTVWVASYGNSGGGRMVQILGLAAPTVPLKALGKPGVMP